MSVTYATALKTTRMTDVVAAIDASGDGVLNIGTAGMGTLLATFTLSATCGTVTGAVLTFSGTPLVDASAANTNTAASAEVRTGGGTLIISGLTVGTSGADINLASVAITAGQSVTITSATITHG